MRDLSKTHRQTPHLYSWICHVLRKDRKLLRGQTNGRIPRNLCFSGQNLMRAVNRQPLFTARATRRAFRMPAQPRTFSQTGLLHRGVSLALLRFSPQLRSSRARLRTCRRSKVVSKACAAEHRMFKSLTKEWSCSPSRSRWD